LLKVVTVDMSGKNGDILIRYEHIHHLVTVSGKPFPFRFEIEQRTMGEHYYRRSIRKAGDVSLEPCELVRVDFRTTTRDVVERDKMDALVIE
jgi:hypothetical protein